MTDRITQEMMVADAKARGLSHRQTRLTYALRNAISEESQRPFDWAYQWQDKPHRLVFAATEMIDALASVIADLLSGRNGAVGNAKALLKELDEQQ